MIVYSKVERGWKAGRMVVRTLKYVAVNHNEWISIHLTFTLLLFHPSKPCKQEHYCSYCLAFIWPTFRDSNFLLGCKLIKHNAHMRRFLLFFQISSFQTDLAARQEAYTHLEEENKSMEESNQNYEVAVNGLNQEITVSIYIWFWTLILSSPSWPHDLR